MKKLEERSFYKAWESMKYRCKCPTAKNYHNYGGRGITFQKDWEKFENFKKDMFPSWEKGLSLDRKNVNGNYTKKNCQWATLLQQHLNRRDAVSYLGETSAQASLRMGGGRGAVLDRINKYGWSLKDAFTTPLRKKKYDK